LAHVFYKKFKAVNVYCGVAAKRLDYDIIVVVVFAAAAATALLCCCCCLKRFMYK